jgi:AcrR family transcriptional regulator
MDPETLWGEQPRRLGRPPAHSRAKVVAEAIALADAEGLPAVTMRRVAERVGAGTMSLYTYVPDKETLLELMIDETGAEADLPAVSGEWRADLRALAHAQRAVMRRHPWLHVALPLRQTLGPSTLAAMEHALAVLEPTGLDARARLEVFALLTGFLLTYTALETARADTAHRTGRTPQALAEAQSRHLRAAVADGAHPHLAAALTSALPSPPPTFDHLLDRMITGLIGP